MKTIKVKRFPEAFNIYLDMEGNVYRVVKGVVYKKSTYLLMGYPAFKSQGKASTVHAAMLKTFVGPPPLGYQAAHLDGSRTNNVLTNLKWCSPKENNAHKSKHGTQMYGERHHASRLKDATVLEILKLYKTGMRQFQVAKVFGLQRGVVNRIVLGRTWSHVTGLPRALRRSRTSSKLKPDEPTPSPVPDGPPA